MIFNNFEECLSKIKGIPIIIPVFNNLTYTRDTVNFFHNMGQENIVLVDNASSYEPMIDYFKNVSNDVNIITQNVNAGPRQFFEDKGVYSLLPEYFIVTDPDLKFSNKLPTDFIDILIDVHNNFDVFKVGSSLNLNLLERNVLDEVYSIWGKQNTIRNIEQGYYTNQVGSIGEDSIWSAPIDTTFALYKKSNFKNNFLEAVRIDGRFCVDHLGWLNPSPLPEEEYLFYINNLEKNISSTEVLKKNKEIR